MMTVGALNQRVPRTRAWLLNIVSIISHNTHSFTLRHSAYIKHRAVLLAISPPHRKAVKLQYSPTILWYWRTWIIRGSRICQQCAQPAKWFVGWEIQHSPNYCMWYSQLLFVHSSCIFMCWCSFSSKLFRCSSQKDSLIFALMHKFIHTDLRPHALYGEIWTTSTAISIPIAVPSPPCSLI